jgi:hypothetical protein
VDGPASKIEWHIWSNPNGVVGRRISATSATATSATLNSTYAQYGRLTIGYVGVAPTSLGRVKSIFK